MKIDLINFTDKAVSQIVTQLPTVLWNKKIKKDEWKICRECFENLKKVEEGCVRRWALCFPRDSLTWLYLYISTNICVPNHTHIHTHTCIFTNAKAFKYILKMTSLVYIYVWIYSRGKLREQGREKHYMRKKIKLFFFGERRAIHLRQLPSPEYVKFSHKFTNIFSPRVV